MRTVEKKMIRVGNGWGFTFPKAFLEEFNARPLFDTYRLEILEEGKVMITKIGTEAP